MQRRVFDDMRFRNSGMSEDCLYLNVWTPSTSPDQKLPVLVYYYGGGFVAGDGSEFRYDGESMAQRGIVVVTMSYRLGIFGFFAHPDLTAESPHHASGNYTLMDQAQALRWVQENIAAFGGDPRRVTIAGESAGSSAVSAQMASPLARDLIAGAIGESGSVVGSRPPVSLADAERTGREFGERIGASSLKELRALSAMELLEASASRGAPRFSWNVDGYFFPRSPLEIFRNGEQAHVPLLVGWNSEESGFRAILGRNDPTPENFAKAVRELYGNDADEVLRLYPSATVEQTIKSATDLAGDRFIGFSTWRWFDLQRRTGERPVFRYFYTHPRPPVISEASSGDSGGSSGAQAGTPAVSPGAVHSAEIEYAMGNLSTNPVFAWKEVDFQVSKTLQGYFANFIKSGNPNGAGLPEWPAAATSGNTRSMMMRIDVTSQAEPAASGDRYLFLERLSEKKPE